MIVVPAVFTTGFVAVTRVSLKATWAPVTKPVPLIVRLTGLAPAFRVAGESPVIVNCASTVTVAVPQIDFETERQAVTVALPGADGAVYSPEPLMVPEDAVHATPLSPSTPPETLALNSSAPPTVTLAVAGETATVAGTSVMVTLAVSLLSEVLVAVRVTVCSDVTGDGAVYV